MHKTQSKHELKLDVLASDDSGNLRSGVTVLDSAGTLVRFNEIERPAFRWLAAWQSEVKAVNATVDTTGMADAKQHVLSALNAQFGHEPTLGQPGSPVYQLLETIARAGSVASVIQAVPSSSHN